MRGAQGLALLGLVVGVLLGPSPAAAEPYDEDLPISSASPADGAVISSKLGGPIPFEIRSSQTGMNYLSIEVASQNIPGQDGTLAEDFRVGFFGLQESDAFPGTYRGESLYAPGVSLWSSTPGTYFWQAYGSCFTWPDPPCDEVIRYFKSPVYTIVIQDPPESSAPQAGQEAPAATPCSRARSARNRIRRRLIVYRNVAQRRSRQARLARNPSSRRRHLRVAKKKRRQIRRSRIQLRRATQRVRRACS